MNFDFTEDQTSLRDAVRRFVDKAYTFDERRQIVKAGGFSRPVWDGLASLGLTALAISETHGGLGFGPVEAMVVMEEIGRGLVMEPYAQAALVAPMVLAQSADAVAADWLPRIASGDALVVLAHQERRARYRLDVCDTTATDDRLTGNKSLVPAGDQVDAFIVPARDAHGIALFLVPKDADGVQLRPYALHDGSRAAELTLANTPALRLVDADRGLDVLEHAVDVAIAAQAAEAVGVMDRFVLLTADYLNTRKQFGVPIASFQALRHRMADVKMQLELARSMSYFATLKLTEPRDTRRRAVSQAKVQLGQSMRFVGQQCTQLHGGIGVTDEYVGSHYFKRLTVMEMQFGDTLHHLAEVSARMQDQAGVFV